MRIQIYLKLNIGDPMKDNHGCTQDLCSGELWDKSVPLWMELPICNDLETDTAIDKEISDLPLVWQELPDHSLSDIWSETEVIGYWP